MATFNVEATDTFGDEANYSWVSRTKISAPEGASRALLVRRAKAALRLKGRHRDVADYGDCIQLDMVGACIRVFIVYTEED